MSYHSHGGGRQLSSFPYLWKTGVQAVVPHQWHLFWWRSYFYWCCCYSLVMEYQPLYGSGVILPHAKGVCVSQVCNSRAVCFPLLPIPLFLSLPLCLSKPFHSFLQAEVIHLWKSSSFQRTFKGCQNSLETAVQPFQTAPTSSPVSRVERSLCHSRHGRSSFCFPSLGGDGA